MSKSVKESDRVGSEEDIRKKEEGEEEVGKESRKEEEEEADEQASKGMMAKSRSIIEG